LAAILASIFSPSAALASAALSTTGWAACGRPAEQQPGLRCLAAGTGRQGKGSKTAKQNAFHDKGFQSGKRMGP
jgi:hypothetical protein